MEHAIWQKGFFLTLTFAPEHYPEKPDYKPFQKFLKRLRQHETRKMGNQKRIRYLACGEFGSKTGRFHYHALLWNTSPTLGDSLTELWPLGHAHAGTITTKSIRYVSRYTLKFHAKGKEAVATWSKSPPLGSVGIRALARQMAEDGRYKLTDGIVGPLLEFEFGNGESAKLGPLDQAMRTEFMREFLGQEDFELPVDALQAHDAWLKEKSQGDPTIALARLQEEKNTFWETARLRYEKL